MQYLGKFLLMFWIMVFSVSAILAAIVAFKDRIYWFLILSLILFVSAICFFTTFMGV